MAGPVPGDPVLDRQMLPVTQSVVLQCFRTWAVGARLTIDVAPRIREMMARLGVDPAHDYLDRFMAALRAGAVRPIGFDMVEQRSVSADERQLLGVLTFAQESRPGEALLLLRTMVRGAAATGVLRAAEGLGTELALAGRFLEPAALALPSVEPGRVRPVGRAVPRPRLERVGGRRDA